VKFKFGTPFRLLFTLIVLRSSCFCFKKYVHIVARNINRNSKQKQNCPWGVLTTNYKVNFFPFVMGIFDWPITTIIIIIISIFENSQKIYILISSFGLLTIVLSIFLKIQYLLYNFLWIEKTIPEIILGEIPSPPSPPKNSGKLEPTQMASWLRNFLHKNPWCLTIWLAENTNRGTVGTPENMSLIHAFRIVFWPSI